MSPIGIDSDIEKSVNIAIHQRSGCLGDLSQGRYMIRVFDWQDGGRGPVHVYTEVVDVEEKPRIISVLHSFLSLLISLSVSLCLSLSAES